MTADAPALTPIEERRLSALLARTDLTADERGELAGLLRKDGERMRDPGAAIAAAGRRYG